MIEAYAGQLHSADDLIATVEQYGFLPFFRNEIPGFSVEELCPPELWFADDADGPREWKGPVARSGKCLYGKLFNKKAGFVSREWIPDFANFRRDGYDFDARWDDGLASYKDKELYETIADEGRILSKRLKEAENYRKGGNTGFETSITRLQMQSYVCIADFVYMQDKYGKPYGWGVAEYSTPEILFGYAGEIYFTHNPMSINYPQWIAFAKYSYSQLKWAVINKPDVQNAYVLGKINEELYRVIDSTNALFDDFSKDYIVIME